MDFNIYLGGGGAGIRDIIPDVVRLHVQQTPNPLAQDPALVPPLFVHSDLKI